MLRQELVEVLTPSFNGSPKECVLQVNERVLPLSPIRISQGLFGSYPYEAASSFLSRCVFPPWDDPATMRAAVEAPPATFFTWAAVAVSRGSTAAAAATGTVPARGRVAGPPWARPGHEPRTSESQGWRLLRATLLDRF